MYIDRPIRIPAVGQGSLTLRSCWAIRLLPEAATDASVRGASCRFRGLSP
jgi:hypothetical protein